MGAAFHEDAPPLAEVFALEDEGDTVLVNPPEGSLAKPYVYEAVQCLLDQTDAPATVEQKLGATTPLMGAQSETWDGIAMEWSVAASQFGGPDLTASFVMTD